MIPKTFASLEDIKIKGDLGDRCDDLDITDDSTSYDPKDQFILEAIRDKRADQDQRKIFADRAYNLAKRGAVWLGLCVSYFSNR